MSEFDAGRGPWIRVTFGECRICEEMQNGEWPTLPEIEDWNDPRRGRFACVLIDETGEQYGEPRYIMPTRDTFTVDAANDT